VQLMSKLMSNLTAAERKKLTIPNPAARRPDPQHPVALLDPKPRLASECDVELIGGGRDSRAPGRAGHEKTPAPCAAGEGAIRAPARVPTRAGYLAVPVFRSPFAALQHIGLPTRHHSEVVWLPRAINEFCGEPVGDPHK
jgi:hypothetical protein